MGFFQQNQFNGLIWVWTWAIIMYLFHRLKSQERRQLLDRIHAERMKAIEKGVPYPELPPYALEEPEAPHAPKDPRKMLGAAAICVFGGAGLLAAMLASPSDRLRELWTFGLVPVFAGLGLCAHYWIVHTGSKSGR
ncbi:MAG: hypothetical protein FJW39_15610 [Acidobacteria bacterium]|nr:hypothetical protein [Acidobacteriota bacterium]